MLSHIFKVEIWNDILVGTVILANFVFFSSAFVV